MKFLKFKLRWTYVLCLLTCTYLLQGEVYSEVLQEQHHRRVVAIVVALYSVIVVIQY